jgi:hypothetical protein
MSYSVLKKAAQSRWVGNYSCMTLIMLIRQYGEQTTQTILETLRHPKPDVAPTATDKLRLVIVFYLSLPDHAISKEEIAELEKELKVAGANVAAFEYVRRWVTF